MNQETKAVLDWVLELIDGCLSLQEGSLPTKHPIFQELQSSLCVGVSNDLDSSTKAWVLKQMKKQFGFDGTEFDIWTHPENYIFDQIQSVAVFLRLGLERVDWLLLGEQLKQKCINSGVKNEDA